MLSRLFKGDRTFTSPSCGLASRQKRKLLWKRAGVGSFEMLRSRFWIGRPLRRSKAFRLTSDSIPQPTWLQRYSLVLTDKVYRRLCV
jgi:hypothetical protein